MTSKPRGDKPSNVPSLLLHDHENETLFQVMGRICTTLATGVVQLYLADQGDRNRWSKRCCGVACFVKDGSKKSFYIRIYDIKKHTLIWEQELYNLFVYKTPREYFHTFEADNCQAGMNFASEDEALKFKKAVEGKLQERSRKRQERKRQTSHRQTSNRPPGSAVQRAPQPPPPAAQPVTVNVDVGRNSNNNFSSATLKKDKKKVDAKKKLTKADIGTPSDFRHVSHVGWDPDKGFDMNNLDNDMQKLFQSVGIRPDDTLDKATVDFIYDFVEKHGGLEAVKKEFGPAKTTPPPLPPTKRNNAAPAQPPAPPSRVPTQPPAPPSRGLPNPPRVQAPVPPPSRGVPAPARNVAPAPLHPPVAMSTPPPLPPSVASVPSPPIAPPLPPALPPALPPQLLSGDSSGGGESTVGRGALLDAIRSGTTLKQAQAAVEAPKTADSRGQLLDAIRQGANLKKLEAVEDRPASNPVEMDGIVGALAKALASRRPACVDSDDEDDSDDDDDDVDDDDDDWDD